MKKFRSLISQAEEAVREKVVAALRDGATYRDAAELFRKLTGQRISQMAVQSFYRGEYSEIREKIRVAKNLAEQIAGAVGDDRQLEKGAMAAMTQRLFENLADFKGTAEELKTSGGLMLDLQHAYNEAARLEIEKQKQAAREKSLALDEKQLALAREKFEFNAAQAALAQLPALRAIAGDQSLNQEARIAAVRKKLFGVLPS